MQLCDEKEVEPEQEEEEVQGEEQVKGKEEEQVHMPSIPYIAFLLDLQNQNLVS